MSGLEIAKAYVQIVPVAKGLGEAIAKEADQQSDEPGKKAGGRFANAFGLAVKGSGKVVAAAGAATAAAAGAAVAAAASITKAAIENFAEFEQLEGGAKLMFGDAYDFIAEKAAGAYASVQMSQNEYLTQVNGLATGLKSAMGGNAQAAAELADKVVTAEADIVSATGNSQENIQNAFNGIMKSNFSMLDNLQLGITPTKAGFQEVIDKVNEWNAANGEATSYQIENIADCQAALVDYVEMQGMAGYAQREGAQTIQGSLSATRAAWDNLLTGMASGNADLGGLIDGLVTSAESLWTNLEPVVFQSIEGITSLVTQIAPRITEKIPGLVSEVVPKLAQAAGEMLSAFVTALSDNAGTLAKSALDIIMILGTAILENLPIILQASLNIIAEIAIGIGQALPDLIPAIVDVVLSIAENLIDNVDLLIDGAIALMVGLAEGIVNAIPRLVDKAPEIVVKLAAAIVRNAPKLVVAALELIAQIALGLSKGVESLVRLASTILKAIKNGLLSGLGAMGDIGKNLISGLWEGISGRIAWIKEKIAGFGRAITGTLKSIFGIHSPSKVMEQDVGRFLPEGLAVGINKNKRVVDDAIRDMSVDAVHLAKLQTTIDYGEMKNADGTEGALWAILELLRQFPELLKSLKVVMDSGELVGALVDEVDKQMGEKTDRNERGVVLT